MQKSEEKSRLLGKEVPNQSETDHEIAVGIIGSGIKTALRKRRIEVLQFEIDPRLPDPGIDKKVKVFQNMIDWSGNTV